MRVPGFACPGHVLRRGRAASPQQLHEHERLVDGAHAHPLGDERAQAEEGSRGAGGHRVMVAAAGRPGQVCFGRPVRLPLLGSRLAVPPQSLSQR